MLAHGTGNWKSLTLDAAYVTIASLETVEDDSVSDLLEDELDYYPSRRTAVASGGAISGIVRDHGGVADFTRQALRRGF